MCKFSKNILHAERPRAFGPCTVNIILLSCLLQVIIGNYAFIMQFISGEKNIPINVLKAQSERSINSAVLTLCAC